MDLVANSTPMVDLESRLNSLRVNRLSRLDLPTPESPIRTTADTKSVTIEHREKGQKWCERGNRRLHVRTFEKELRVTSSQHEGEEGRWLGWGNSAWGLDNFVTHIVFVVGHIGGLWQRRRERVADGNGKDTGSG